MEHPVQYKSPSLRFQDTYAALSPNPRSRDVYIYIYKLGIIVVTVLRTRNIFTTKVIVLFLDDNATKLMGKKRKIQGGVKMVSARFGFFSGAECLPRVSKKQN